MNIRQAKDTDIEEITKIYATCFPKERNHKLWIEASFNSYPRGVYYVIENDDVISGYILWCVKNGFRNNTIVELEQIGVHPDHARRGLGRNLIETSITEFKKHVNKIGHSVEAIFVTTSEGHFAEKLYKSTLGVSRSAVISGYANGNEVILYNNRLS